MTPHISKVLIFGVSFLLTACFGGGGGGGGNNPPANNAPSFTSGTGISIAENTTATGYTAVATDADGDTVTYSVTGGSDQAAFSINVNSGVLSFQSAPDFETPTDSDTNNTYVVDINASDGVNSTIQTVTVTVNDTVEVAAITIDAISNTNINENSDYTSVTPSLSGDTPIGSVTYSLTGTDAGDFTINASTGVVSMVARDFEAPADANTDNVYELTITATDDDGNSDSESWTVTVDDVMEAAVFTIDAISNSNVNENTTYTSVTPNLSGDTPIGNVTYTLSGADAGTFTINASTGVVSMVARDFEAPADANTDNVYELTISATDDDGNSDSESWTVTVDDVVEAAAFTIDTIDNVSLAENGAYTSVTPNISGDAPIGNITFSLSGNDAGDFTINSTTGVVSMVARDWENPVDANTDNVYELIITATDDDGNNDSESWMVTITDLTEVGVLNVTASQVDIKTIQFDWQSYPDATHYKLYVDPDGGSGYTLLQDNLANTSTSTTIEVPVHLTDWVNADYLLEAHDDSAILTSATTGIASLMLDSVGYFKASNTGSGDLFSRSISLSADGTTLVVGAYLENSNHTGISTDGTGESDNSASGAGAVYVFSRSGSTWTQQAYIKASNAEGGFLNEDQFGWSVSLSADGNTLAVGAKNEDSDANGISTDGTGESDNTATNAGAVYVFSRSGSTWTQQAYIKASNSDGGDNFGDTVSLASDGNTLAVGASGESSNATGVSTDSTGESDNSESGAGAVYLFTRSGSTWIQHSYIKASNTEGDVLPQDGDRFGWSVSLSADGNTLAVGAENEDSDADGIDGSQTDDCSAGSPTNCADLSGAVYVFTLSGGNWSQQAYVKASNSEADDTFGKAVSLSTDGNTLAVGAFKESSNATGISTDGTGEGNNTATDAGAVYVFSRSGSTWSQQAYIKASNTEAGDFFGASVNLSSDGNTLAVGAGNEDSSATGIDGSQADSSSSNAGAVYIFNRSGITWSQQAYVKSSDNTNTASGDNFGGSVNLSADGNTLAVGAVGEQSNATGIGGDKTDNSLIPPSGAVYMY